MLRPIRRWLSLLLVATLGIGGAQVAAQPAAASSSAALTSTPDTVYYWNDVLLETFRRQGGAPAPLARAAAMMHVGVFDTITAVANALGQAPIYEHYLTVRASDIPVDDNLAAGIVARDLLIATLPAQRSFVEQKFAERHGTAAQTAAEDLAAEVVSAMLNERDGDGSTPAPTYVLENVPGAWRPTGQGCETAANAATPHWGNVKPFTLTSGSMFRRPLPGGHTTYPALLSSKLYADQVNEVKDLGRVDSATRTAEQTEIAWFWANDLDDTYKPPGQLLDHTRLVLEAELPTISTNVDEALYAARTFGLVSLAMADAAVAAWDQKYLTSIDLWRPYSAIREAGTDGNPETDADPEWQPLSADKDGQHFSPCFPAWVSGHATFAAAWAGVMRYVFGDIPFTATTEDPHALGVERTFPNFDAAAVENARSRIYLGVHYQFDADDGLATGYQVANHVVGNYLFPYL